MKSIYVKRLIIILLIFTGLEYSAKSQNNPETVVKPVFITGITYESKTQLSLPNVNFRINNKNSFSSNESGRFSFNGFPGDTIDFSYIGFHPTRLIVPDTLNSAEYVMGIFMQEDTVRLAEIIILPRMVSSSIIIVPVQTDQKAKDIAQKNVNDAVAKGLTQLPKVYDADMNVKKAIRANQMRTEYKGMLVTPENSVGVSIQSYRTYRMLYGSPIPTPNSTDKEMITNNESRFLLEHFKAMQRILLQTEAISDTIVSP